MAKTEVKATTVAKCGADKRSGGKCGRPAGWGTGHVGYGRCKLHGGSTPTQEMGAAVELARREGALHSTPIDIDPHDAILQCVRISAGWVRYSADRLEELGAGDLVGAQVSTRPLKLQKGAEDPSTRVEDHGPPAVHIWLKVHTEFMDRLVHYSKTAIACGIAERQVKIAESQARAFAEALKNFAVALGYDPSDPKVRTAARASLQLVASNGRTLAA